MTDMLEQIFAFGLAAEPEIHMATRQKEIVQLFQDYFNAIWERAKIIKSAGEPADSRIIQYIRQQYHPTPNH